MESSLQYRVSYLPKGPTRFGFQNKTYRLGPVSDTQEAEFALEGSSRRDGGWEGGKGVAWRESKVEGSWVRGSCCDAEG